MPRSVVALLGLCLFVGLLPPGAAIAAAPAADPVSQVQSISGLKLPLAKTLAKVIAVPFALKPVIRPKADGIRVGLVSSGVDKAVLPEVLREQVTLVGGSDTVGYGTYAASVLLQAAPDARITSLAVYPGGKFDPRAQASSLEWAVAHAKDLDAVLYALPPHEFLDPVSASMSSGDWAAVTSAMADAPIAGPNGPAMGVPLDPALRRTQGASLSARQRQAVDRFAYLTDRWQKATDQVKKLNAAGVLVVAPAGDLGPNLQTIVGFANMPEVVAVGAATEKGIAAHSSSGPSADGHIKPDLVAPAGVVGLVPDASPLAKALGTQKLLDASLKPAWDAGDPFTKSRTRLDSSLASAAVVSVASAGMARGGLRDAAKQRGALTAASVPIAGEPVWRQGAGLLRLMPDAAFAASRPLALGFADLGAEPDSGSWSSTVQFVQGAPSSARTKLSSFAGVGPDAKTYTRSVGQSQAPVPAVSVSDKGVEISLGLGDQRYEGGVFCGYTDVSVPTTSGTVTPAVTVTGLPAGVEQLPTCLVKGSQLTAFGFYIHNMPAEDLTFALLPALPAGADLLEKPLGMLPLNPLHTKLYQRVTGPDGNAYFPNIVPGFYTVRLFSDYGAPVTQDLVSSAAGSIVPKLAELGENPSYLSFDALVLSATGWTEQDLKNTLGADKVEKDKPTGGYWVTVGPKKMLVLLGFVQDKPGVAVSSRYIDLLGYEDLKFGAVPLTDALRLQQLSKLPVVQDLRGWVFREGAPGSIEATLNPLVAAASEQDVLGVGTYPFALTTPNYTAHMSLNFSYQTDNAFILVLVKMGDESAAAVVTPWGTVATPTIGGPVGTLPTINRDANGLASFDFNMKPKGASKGSLTFVFIPSRPVQQLAAPVTTASISDLSFELDTWQRVQWPGQMTPHGMGHLFSFSPNYSSSQMSAGECRPIDSGGVKADVCEDWRVMVQSPLDDAETIELVDGNGSVNPSIKVSKTTYADPKRGTRDFGSVLAFDLPKPGGLDALAAVVPSEFRTNGRFWEQLALSEGVVKQHPGPIQVQIVDNELGRNSDLAGHVTGPVPVAPYVPFASRGDALKTNGLSITDLDRDGVPQLSFAELAPTLDDLVLDVTSLGDPDDADAAVPGAAGALLGAELPVTPAVGDAMSALSTSALPLREVVAPAAVQPAPAAVAPQKVKAPALKGVRVPQLKLSLVGIRKPRK